MVACCWTGWHQFDGWGLNLLDLRFADDIIIFVRSRQRTLVINRFIDDTFGADMFAVKSGRDRDANQ